MTAPPTNASFQAKQFELKTLSRRLGHTESNPSYHSQPQPRDWLDVVSNLLVLFAALHAFNYIVKVCSIEVFETALYQSGYRSPHLQTSRCIG
jgi:hypothetical protein